ncbi:MAG: extracellular solute-binding protein, partial [Nocardioidaceae bacterium]
MKRTLALTAAALSAVLALTSCGNSLDSGSSDNGGDDSSDSSGSGGGDGSSLGGSSKGTLTVWIMDGTNTDQKSYFAALNKQFESQHKGVTVDVQFVPWTAAHDKFTTSVAGGKGPDVAEMGTTWNPEFAEAGGLTDLTTQMKKSGVAESMVPGSLTSTKYDGKYYGVPWYAGVRSIVYRKDWFTKLGIEPPHTWDDLVSAGNTIKQKMPDVYPFAVAGDYEYEVYPFLWGAGGDIATESDGKWTATIDQPKALEGIKFFTGLLTEHHFSPKGAATW